MQVEGRITRSTSNLADGACLEPMSSLVHRTFGGTWLWGHVQVASDGQKDCMGLVWSGAKRTMEIAGGSLRVVDHYDETKVLCEIKFNPGPFPPSPSGTLRSAPVDTLYARFVFLLETPTISTLCGKSGRGVPLAAGTPALLQPTALSDLLSSQVPHNVVLRFPRCAREIWTSESILVRSPYLKVLLSSGFNESLSLAPEVSKDSSTTSLVEHRKTGVLSRLCGLLEVLPHKAITITEASYTTYLAVVGYLYTGEILFSPLRAGQGKTAAAPRTAFLTPASPKSVLRLSHLLELDALSSLALSNYASQLTPRIAASELFSPLARLYPDIGKAILRYVVDKAHYGAVMEVQEMKERARRVEEGEAEPEEAAMMYKILRRHAEGR